MKDAISEQEDLRMIAEIKERHSSTQEGIEIGTMRIGMPTAIVAHNDRKFLLEIVDSQAQTIAEQAKEIEQARTIADEWREKAGSKYDPFPWETTDSKEVKL